MSQRLTSGLAQRRAKAEAPNDSRAHLHLGKGQRVRVTCDECGWESRWRGTLDLAWTAFKAHRRAKHPETGPEAEIRGAA